ncbi:MAG: alpha-glucuronidase [Prevotella sp.]|nr:alpha-glucuronidase [Prevotella sp.]
MKKLLIITLLSLITHHLSLITSYAEDGSRLWLRYDSTLVQDLTLRIDSTMPLDDGYRISGKVITARTQQGLLYGKYAYLRGEQGESHPYFRLRILNHWDNLDGSIERGYAGRSIFWNDSSLITSPSSTKSRAEANYSLLTINSSLIEHYAEACASIGINGTVLNNVNASPKILTRPYINKVREIADLLRPWGIRVYLSVNFGTPKALGETHTADPLNPQVRRWWSNKAKEIYQQIPDFGGFLVKANSEGQPGPFDYGRTHADGANMLAEALRPYGGIVMWRSFVYGAKHKGEDRVMQAVSEFAELDGQFAENVILQSKNGPLDFQPREPYAPIFDQMKQTRQMAELQITQEYLGQGDHLVFLAPMWKEFFSFVSPSRLEGIAGVANIGLDTNWCGHHFAQANWYAFGRLAWNPTLSSRQIAEEWISQSFSEQLIVNSEEFATATPSSTTSTTPSSTESAAVANYSLFTIHSKLINMMLRSREACVDYMMPLGLHHIFKFDHHMGPEPDGFKAEYPLEWCPVYYHQADTAGIGFDRNSRGTGATGQYREPYHTLYDSPTTCPEQYLLWFHHLPWTYRTLSGRTLWEEMQYRYQRGVSEVESFIRIWQEARPYIDEQRWLEVDGKLQRQLDDAREWHDTCLKYFGSFANPEKQ